MVADLSFDSDFFNSRESFFLERFIMAAVCARYKVFIVAIAKICY